MPAQIKTFQINKAQLEKLPKPLKDLFLLQEFDEDDMLENNQMEFTLEMIASYVKDCHPDFSWKQMSLSELFGWLLD